MQIISAAPDYTLCKEGAAIGWATLRDGRLERLEIAPAWRRRGYGTFFLKELLRQNGGLNRSVPSRFTAPLPAAGDAAAWALARKFGFVGQGGMLCRTRAPDFSAVQFCHEFLQARLQPGGLYLDATCGNGHDTLFLCRLAGPEGRVIGLDIQPQAVAATNALLAREGFATTGRAELCDHRHLGRFAPPGSADCVLFNFGWLPGAPHGVYSTAESTLPALQAALEALRPGGVLAAVLYSGKVIGDAEKQAALSFFGALPLARYTVLVCRFANWAECAPLPCFVLKKPGAPP